MSSHLLINELFGPAAEDYLGLVARMEAELSERTIRYEFLSPDDFEDLLINQPKRAMHIYWKELVGRAHFAAVSSILRSAQWLKGAKMSAERGLYLPFCGNVRSLIESAADSLDGISGVAQTIAENVAAVNKLLAMQSDKIVISKELEDQLIHFSHGRKVAKHEPAPQCHAAKSARSYIDRLELLGLDQAHAVYGRLCQVTHPASDSVSHFLSQIGGSEFRLFPHNDRVAISALVSGEEVFFTALLRYAFNQPIILLRVLLHINLRQYHLKEVSRIDISSMPGWQKCARLMGVAP